MIEKLDYTLPIELAPKVWWVGYVIPDDPFQCHVYLIENGKDSIIIDPGSKITWKVTRKKILKIMPLENIKYIICHHQDPDITAAVEDLLSEIGTQNRFVVTHWRTAVLLKHYNWGIDFYKIEKHNWKLKAKDIELEFIFTPYMHFAGAFCTYYKKDKILFSSDIFGAFTDSFKLFAEDKEEYFKQIKPFFMHYMPSKEVVNYGLSNIEKKDIDLIAPQHGSIIKKELIPYIIKGLKELDVGLYTEFYCYGDAKKLLKAFDIISKLYEELLFFQNGLYDELNKIIKDSKELFEIKKIIFITNIDNEMAVFNSFLKTPIELGKKDIKPFIDTLLKQKSKIYLSNKIGDIELKKNFLIYSFVVYDKNKNKEGIGYILFDKDFKLKDVDLEILKKFEKILSILFIKEKKYYKIEKYEKSLEKRAIHDELTGLYNRYFLDSIVDKEVEKAKRYGYPLSVIMIDLDDFKKVNDNFGHDVGDLVLKDFSSILKNNLRKSDIVIRYGGEEFLVLMPFTTKESAKKVLEKIQKILHNKSIVLDSTTILSYTFSAGISQYKKDDSLDSLIKRADMLMYKAKRDGKDMITL